MLISQVAPRSNFVEYKTVNEKEFDCLALIDSNRKARACLNIHFRHLALRNPPALPVPLSTKHAPLRGIFGPNSGCVAHYAPFIRPKSPTKCDAQLTKSNFQTRSRSCIFIEDEKYLAKIPEHAAMVITNENLAGKLNSETRGIVITEKPGLFFFMLHNYLSELMIYRRPEYQTVIHESARISNQTFIAEHNVRIGKHVTIEPFVTIHPNVIIGDHTTIRSGAIIGGMGFEFKRNGKEMLPVSHIGGVKLGRYVEIQNAACIDRAIYPWDDTVIGDHTKMDNAVHIGHAAKIGKRVLFAAGATISGRVEIGDDTWIGVGTTISNGISVGKRARVNIGAVVTKNVEDGGSVTGNFAIPHEKFIQNLKSQR